MSLFQKIQTAMETKDADGWIQLYHEDFQFVRHQSGTIMNRDEIYNMMKVMLANNVVQSNHRCLYENEDILFFSQYLS